MNISKILKARRLKLNINQSTLAKHLGFKHKSSVHLLEVGKVDWKFKNVVKACELLELNLTIKSK